MDAGGEARPARRSQRSDVAHFYVRQYQLARESSGGSSRHGWFAESAGELAGAGRRCDVTDDSLTPNSTHGLPSMLRATHVTAVRRVAPDRCRNLVSPGRIGAVNRDPVARPQVALLNHLLRGDVVDDVDPQPCDSSSPRSSPSDHSTTRPLPSSSVAAPPSRTSWIHPAGATQSSSRSSSPTRSSQSGGDPPPRRVRSGRNQRRLAC
jgi:hypothetical protein